LRSRALAFLAPFLSVPLSLGACGGGNSTGAAPGDGGSGDGTLTDARPSDGAPGDADGGVPCVDAGPTATWKFVDGDQPRGIAASSGTAKTYEPQLVAFNGKLYLTWSESVEDDGGNFASVVVHVAVYGGDDANPTWTNVDNGGTIFGAVTGTTPAPYLAVAN